MDRWTYACLVVGLLLLAAPAGALIPDSITINETSWVTAGSGQTSPVTVWVLNGSDGVSGVGVELGVDSAYGSISPTHVTTDNNGKAMATFRPGTVAGTATITATVSEGVDEPLAGTGEQQIDHAAAHKVANLWYEPEVTAGETTEIIVRMVDEYGNVVDGRRENAEGTAPEEVFFMVGSPASFVGGTDEIRVPVDAAGNVTATLRVDAMAGGNIVWVQPPSPLERHSFTITSVGGLPADITQAVDPSGASVPADGDKVIELTYTLLDKYGNRAPGQGLWVNASIQRGERPAERQDVLLYSNRYGQVAITYGPEDSVGNATISATAAANASVSVSQDVEFTSTDPVNMVFSASPQSMPSGDVPGSAPALLRAKVMDIKGNPVSGETVEFEIVSNSSAPYKQTEPPALNKTSAVTINGSAVVGFTPGSFAREGEPGWNKTATGTATVRATWENVTRGCHVTRDITLTWKNYPYLSVETEVSPETVAVNDTVDVTIRVKGDGYAMQPDPIDVVLVIDRSGSMKYDIARNSGSSNERMEAAQDAANNFVDQMNSTRDRVALVSFAFDATLDQSLTNEKDEIKGAINGLSADGATNMRLAYYTAIKYLKENGRSNAVKAVILMGDGDWNYHGSPLAKGTGYPNSDPYLSTRYPQYITAILSGYPWSGSDYAFGSEKYEWYQDLPDPKGTLGRQLSWYRYSPHDMYHEGQVCDNGRFTNQNMSVYANSGDDTDRVKIYSIGFASKLDSNVERDLAVLSKATGGNYVWAGDETELRNVYAEIAGELKTEAGVDTKMDIVFEQVNVTGGDLPGADVFDYVYDDGNSTYICNQTGFEETIDQTSQWDSGQKLHFDIGTIRLGQTWETNFRLKVLTDGNINIFGPGSTITFDDDDNLTLPDTFITAIPDLNNTGITNRWLEVELADPGLGPFTDTVPLTWTVTYNGTRNIDKALAYSNDNGLSWTLFWARTVNRSTTEGETLMDVSNLPAGEYLIRLVASAEDAPEAVDTTTIPVHIGNTSRAYIKIE
ncbi:VWA domain-containing protein [Methanoculleus methanifontis]|nr:VWA domain-containing protein [Methanoculleus sp. FWC-SCC3]